MFHLVDFLRDCNAGDNHAKLLNKFTYKCSIGTGCKLRGKTYRKLALDAKNHALDAKICHRMYLVKISISEDILCSIW
jgi:hypothetical protein